MVQILDFPSEPIKEKNVPKHPNIERDGTRITIMSTHGIRTSCDCHVIQYARIYIILLCLQLSSALVYINMSYYADDACTKKVIEMPPLVIKTHSVCQASFPVSYSDVKCDTVAGTTSMVMQFMDISLIIDFNTECKTYGDIIVWVFTSTNTLLNTNTIVTNIAALESTSMYIHFDDPFSSRKPLACNISHLDCLTSPVTNMLRQCNLSQVNDIWFTVDCFEAPQDPAEGILPIDDLGVFHVTWEHTLRAAQSIRLRW